MPGFWNAVEVDGKPMGSHGFATYRLVILLPSSEAKFTHHIRVGTAASAVRMFAGGRSIFEAGAVGDSAKTHRPRYRTGIASIPPTSDGRIELIAQVSNFQERNGGLWPPIFLGRETAVKNLELRGLTLDLFLFGAIFIMGLYHLSLFIMRREDRASLLFGLFCLIVALRITLRSEFVFGRFLPDVPWIWSFRGEYFTFYLAVPFFAHFLLATFADPWRKWGARVLWIFPVFSCALAAVTPVTFFSPLLVYYQAFAGIVVIFCIVFWIRAIARGRKGSVISAGAGVLLVSAFVNDILYANGAIQSIELTPGAIFLFVLSQSYVLAVSFSAAAKSVSQLTEKLDRKSQELAETNEALVRFVPSAFLRQLGKPDIRDIALGDQIETDMGIVFAEMHSFAEMSEKLTPEENFNFLNSYLERIAPVVGQNRGFIDKYIGNTIMALFPEQGADALETAIAMQERIRLYNQQRLRSGYEPIRVGIGLHSGRLMLGTIGAQERMDGTVISDAVNTAARIEALTHVYDSYILMSENVFKGLKNAHEYLVRMVDSVVVKGKSTRVSVFEVFNGAPEYRIEMFNATRSDFDRGIFAFSTGNMEGCRDAMQKVLDFNPGDRAAQIYMERTKLAQ